MNQLIIENALLGRYELGKIKFDKRRKYIKCTQCGKKIPVNDANIYIWKLTKEEVYKVLEIGDYMSFDMPPMILCSICNNKFVK